MLQRLNELVHWSLDVEDLRDDDGHDEYENGHNCYLDGAVVDGEGDLTEEGEFSFRKVRKPRPLKEKTEKKKEPEQ